MSELVKRILVGIIGIPLAVLIIYAGGYAFASVVAIISSMGLWEFYKLARKKNAFPAVWTGIVANIVLIFSFYYLYTNNFQTKTAAILLAEIFFFVLLILTISLWSKKPNAVLNISTTISGLFYITLAFCFLIAVREFYHPDWLGFSSERYAAVSPDLRTFLTNLDSTKCAWLLLSIFGSIWICDSAAYFIGRKIGKHKLFPRVSPKKSWEGAISGFIFGIGGFIGLNYAFNLQMPLIHSIVIGAIAGSIGQIGDLAESLLKRDADVKDSSSLIPGHGGILDRFDSIMFVVPSVYIYLFAVISLI